jgi:hypothetical protein
MSNHIVDVLRDEKHRYTARNTVDAGTNIWSIKYLGDGDYAISVALTTPGEDMVLRSSAGALELVGKETSETIVMSVGNERYENVPVMGWVRS